MLDFIKDYIIQMILAGVAGIIVSKIALNGYRAKAALRVIIATLQQTVIEEKQLDKEGKGILSKDQLKHLEFFTNIMKKKISMDSSKAITNTIKKEKKILLNKGYITREGKSTMKSILLLVAICLCFAVPCMADDSPFINDLNIAGIANEHSINLNSGYMIDLGRADGATALEAIHTTTLLEYNLYEESGLNIDVGYRDKNGALGGVSIDLQLAKYFKKVNMPIIRNIDPQIGYCLVWNLDQAPEDKAISHGVYFTLLKMKI